MARASSSTQRGHRNVSAVSPIGLPRRTRLVTSHNHEVRPYRLPRKRALLIGVSSGENEDANYMLQSARDVDAIQQLLIDCYGYETRDIVSLLEDENRDKHLRPTKGNIIHQMKTLVRNAMPGDQFFLFYAGHGMQSPCHSDTETDGEDEFMACEGGRYIKDNRLRKLLVDKLPPGTQLVALFDTCHAGSMLDLPHTSCNRVYALSFVAVFVTRLHLTVVGVRMRAGSRSPPESPRSPSEGAHPHNHVRRSRCNGDCDISPDPRPHVVSISSTADNEESWEDGKGGPLTRAFVKIARDNPHIPYRDLMIALRQQLYKTCSKRCIKMDKWLEENRSLMSPEEMIEYSELCERAKRPQRPQLSSLQRLDLNKPLVL